MQKSWRELERIRDKEGRYNKNQSSRRIRQREEKTMEPKIICLLEDNGTMELHQEEPNGTIIVHTFFDSSDVTETIPADDMAMLVGAYQLIRSNDIQNDFINPYGTVSQDEYIRSLLGKGKIRHFPERK